mmetsp:Transcript_9665/g.29368  ORF Transcript_9665/g.29368 Transcript_9665/m.29368 type:complete len:211 (+) Transcript_9665:271-903(+)
MYNSSVFGGFGQNNTSNGFGGFGGNNNNNNNNGGNAFGGNMNRNQNNQNGNNKSSRLCRLFQAGNCKYGANCKFEHPNAGNQQMGNAFGNDNFGNRKDKREVCKHYMNNRCNFGDKCRFRHPPDCEIVLRDLEEFPTWPLSSYGIGSKESIITGDMSPEELRLVSYAAAFGGVSRDEIGGKEQQAVEQQKQKFVLLVNQMKQQEAASGNR